MTSGVTCWYCKKSSVEHPELDFFSLVCDRLTFQCSACKADADTYRERHPPNPDHAMEGPMIKWFDH